MPFSRYENADFYLNGLRDKNIIWHPIFYENPIEFNEDWIKPYCIGKTYLEVNDPYLKFNFFIRNEEIVDEDVYCFLCDDDWYEDNVLDTIAQYNEDVIFISMKRGHNDTMTHGSSTLITFDGVRAGSIGLEQMFIKGRILKEVVFGQTVADGMADGVLAEKLQREQRVLHLPDIYALFNYLEKGRWNIVTNNKLQQNQQTGDIRTMSKLQERFERLKKEPRDIHEHLDTLYRYASECDTIVELGVNEGISTTAFVSAKPKNLYCYDYITPNPMLQDLMAICEEETVPLNFTQADSRKIEIPECDLLFIDTLHTYDQLAVELTLHGNRARKYIIMHDTEVFKFKGIVEGSRGLKLAVDEFLTANISKWRLKEHYINNNGLTILERIDSKLVVGWDSNNSVEAISSKKYLIATSAFSNPDLLERCMNSLPGNVDNMIFFDGKNCKEVFREYMSRHPQQKFFTYEDHFGVAQSWNLLLQYAFIHNNYDTVIIVGSDIVMKNGYYESYIKELEEGEFDFTTARGFGFNCFAITRKCYETIGEFDANMFPCYYEDNDYHTRVQLSGLKYGDVGNNTLFEHIDDGSNTIRKDDFYNNANGQTFSMNQKYQIEKWGGTIEDPGAFTYKTPFNNPYLRLCDWKLNIVDYNAKRKIWDK
jgi:hypothetical protein